MRTSFALALLIGLALLRAPADLVAQRCLHGPDESETERARRRAAVAFLQEVNAAQARIQRERGTFVPLVEAASLGAVPVGFVPRLVFDRWSYVVTLKDALDPCGFALVSDQDGLVYEARPVAGGGEAASGPSAAGVAARP
ncbi:MAG TPA: hypothetical protein VNI78_13470 [Vicinamibacterales bacterium]|nr:hypothetical protein [Vicinamibacterales bacterium]